MCELKSDFRLIPTDQCQLHMGHGAKRYRWFTSKCLKHHTPCRNASDEELDVAFALTHLDTWYPSKMAFSIALGWKPYWCHLCFKLSWTIHVLWTTTPDHFAQSQVQGTMRLSRHLKRWRSLSEPAKQSSQNRKNAHVQRPLLWMLPWILKLVESCRTMRDEYPIPAFPGIFTVDPKTFQMESCWIGFFDEKWRLWNHEAVPKKYSNYSSS